MNFLKKIFGIKEDKKSSFENESTNQKNLNESGNSKKNESNLDKDAYKSIIMKRASKIGIPQDNVLSSIKNLSLKEYRLLAECADNFFMVYLWSPNGTKAKADAARAIGINS